MTTRLRPSARRDYAPDVDVQSAWAESSDVGNGTRRILAPLLDHPVASAGVAVTVAVSRLGYSLFIVLTLTEAQMVANARIVRLRELRRDPALLDDYPHRYVAITHRSWWRVRTVLPLLFWAIEHLENQGWEPVAWRMKRWPAIVLRRRDTPPEGNE